MDARNVNLPVYLKFQALLSSRPNRSAVAMASERRGYPDVELTGELRQRVWEGTTFYDIFLFFDQP